MFKEPSYYLKCIYPAQLMHDVLSTQKISLYKLISIFTKKLIIVLLKFLPRMLFKVYLLQLPFKYLVPFDLYH